MQGLMTSQQAGQSRTEQHDGYVVTPLTARDADAVARVHIASFGDSFLATMGVPFLRHYFRAFLDYRQGCGLVCRSRESGEVVGFVCGTESVARHYRVFLLRRSLPVLPAVVWRVIRSPRMAAAVGGRVVRTVRLIVRRRTPSQPPIATAPLPPASLMTIGVHPDHRRHGIGEMLVRSFTSEMARRGVAQVKLGVRGDNVAARQLYERLGWRLAQPEQAGVPGAGSLMYVRDLHVPNATPEYGAQAMTGEDLQTRPTKIDTLSEREQGRKGYGTQQW